LLTKSRVINLKDLTLNAFALAWGGFDSVPDLEVLDDQILVPDSLLQGLIIQDVPLVLVREVVFHALNYILTIGLGVLLKCLNLLQTRIDFVNLQSRDGHKQVKVAAAEVVILPAVHTLAEQFVLLLLALGLDTAGIEQLLRDPNHFTLARFQFCDDLIVKFTILIVVALHPRNNFDESLWIALDVFNKCKVTTVNSFLDPDPLVVLKSSFADLIAHVQNLWHLRIWDHFNLPAVDTGNSIDKSENMGHVVCLNIDTTRSLVTVEDWKDHEGFLLIEEINSLFEKLSNQRSLLPIDAVKFPYLGIENWGKHLMLIYLILNIKLLLVISGQSLWFSLFSCLSKRV
jgi:hypothetical protein